MNNGSPLPAAPPPRLRGIGPLFSAAWSVVRARGLAIVATACLAWFLFAVVASILLSLVVDVPRFNALYENVLSATSNPLAATTINQDLDQLVGGNWLRYGWAGLFAVGLVLLLVYLLCAATASIAVTEQAYAWLEQGRKASVLQGLRRGAARALPGTAILGAYYLVIATIMLLGMAIGGVAGYFLGRALTGGEESLAPGFAALGGVFLGLLAGTAGAVWVYTIWSVSPYAVALSARPWTALGQSRRLTQGNRLEVFIRLLLVTLAATFALAVLTLPFDFLIGLIPLTLGGIAPLLVVLYLRIVISALSPLITTSSLMTMYVDLGGDAAPPSA